MQKGTKRRQRRKSYPFEVPHIVCPPKEVYEKLESWDILEFFRVEFLLRSKKIHEIYRRRHKEAVDALIMGPKYGFDFDEVVDDHAHHRLLHHVWIINDPTPPGDDITPELHRKAELKDKYKLQFSTRPHLRYFQFDCRHPPETIIKWLRPLLAKAYVEASDLPLELPVQTLDGSRVRQHHPYKKPPINNQNLPIWLDYLKCYDLRELEGLTFGEIAKKVYGQSGNKAYRKVEQIYRRVKHMIRQAEDDQWPPKTNPSS